MNYILSHIYLNINKSYHIQLHIKWKKIWWHFVQALAKSKFVSTLYVIYRSYHIGSGQVSTERNHCNRLGSWDLKIATFCFHQLTSSFWKTKTQQTNTVFIYTYYFTTLWNGSYGSVVTAFLCNFLPRVRVPDGSLIFFQFLCR